MSEAASSAMSDSRSDCLFCKIAAHELPGLVIDEDDLVIVFMSLENHPLVVPKRHFTDLYELDDAHAAAIMQSAVRVARAVRTATNCDGLNIVQANGRAAGQDVFHFHLHIKPRYRGDGVSLTWDTQTVPDENRTELCQRIRSALSGAPPNHPS